ncbi:hypothetical protein KIW84_012448 [Lathyrus oleraceus]|uniref:Uncharacterized protein n=1 Tax=Pisum sativum TaxID=3888 RepID=A0A9D5BHW4_PEA|nr:hypothetical protein KIW84_012448 [Pisum sativum]
MENNNNKWSSLSQAYTGSNHGDQPQPGLGVDHGNDLHEEPPVVINNGSNDDNNGNMNDIVFGDGYSNIGVNDQEGSSYSLKVNIPKRNGNNYNEWDQTVRLVLDSKGKIVFLTGAVAEPATGDPRYKQWKSQNSLIITWLVNSIEIGIEDNVLFLKRQENDRVFLFLAGINKDLGEASNSDQGQQPPMSQFPLSTEQLDRLYKLLESPTPSRYIATKGNQKIKMADGSFSAIAGFELKEDDW